MSIITPEQKLLIQLIAKSRISWDTKSIMDITSWLEARGAVAIDPDRDNLTLEYIADSLMCYDLYCIGCHSHWPQYKNSYPFILPRCECCSMKPLKVREANVWAGEARLAYIEQAIYFPTAHLRDLAIYESLVKPLAAREET